MLHKPGVRKWCLDQYMVMRGSLQMSINICIPTNAFTSSTVTSCQGLPGVGACCRCCAAYLLVSTTSNSQTSSVKYLQNISLAESEPTGLAGPGVGPLNGKTYASLSLRSHSLENTSLSLGVKPRGGTTISCARPRNFNQSPRGGLKYDESAI